MAKFMWQLGDEALAKVTAVTMLCSEKKHLLTFSFLSLWKMYRFSQSFQEMSRRKLELHFG